MRRLGRRVDLVEGRELRVDGDLVGVEHLAVDEQVEPCAEWGPEELRPVGKRGARGDAVVADGEPGSGGLLVAEEERDREDAADDRDHERDDEREPRLHHDLPRQKRRSSAHSRKDVKISSRLSDASTTGSRS